MLFSFFGIAIYIYIKYWYTHSRYSPCSHISTKSFNKNWNVGQGRLDGSPAMTSASYHWGWRHHCGHIFDGDIWGAWTKHHLETIFNPHWQYVHLITVVVHKPNCEIEKKVQNRKVRIPGTGQHTPRFQTKDTFKMLQTKKGSPLSICRWKASWTSTPSRLPWQNAAPGIVEEPAMGWCPAPESA